MRPITLQIYGTVPGGTASPSTPVDIGIQTCDSADVVGIGGYVVSEDEITRFGDAYFGTIAKHYLSAR